jgi:hypothetical protein
MDKLRIYVAPKPAPRRPPVGDVNNTEMMLGIGVWVVVIAAFFGGLYWAIWH